MSHRGRRTSAVFWNIQKGPTVDMSSVFMLLSMNKYLQGDISSVGIPMAYLNATLKETIFMKLTNEISTIYIRNHPEFAQHRGCLCVQLKKVCMD